jgi:hypothetical protein
LIAPEWKRIGGIHVQKDGIISVVWMAHDRSTDCIHLYDACVFKREVMAVIAEGLNARGRWIPIAWTQDAKEMADNLLDRGLKMLPEPASDTDASAEMTSRDIWERMRSGRFKVDKRLGEWLAEFKSFSRQDSKIPRDGAPLMSATRHAVASLDWAQRQSAPRTSGTYPQIAIV